MRGPASSVFCGQAGPADQSSANFVSSRCSPKMRRTVPVVER
jgi:hypothetical protein